MTQTKLSNIMLPAFLEAHKVIKAHKHLKHIFKGGRGSGKSSHIALEIIYGVIRYPVTALCVRKVGNTIQESCYEQLKEAISQLNIERYFKFSLSPLKITYTPRGNSIIFRGADDPQKIKSIKVSKFPITFLWIEELAEFKTEDEVSTIEKSILRAELSDGLFYCFYYSYNPPKRKQSWVNKAYETQFLAPNTYVHHSTYLDNTYISSVFRDEAAHIQKNKPQKYDWEYLGKPIGAGIVPFDNLIFRPISEEEVRSFDNTRQGLDWGYATDPLAWVRGQYDKKRRGIYLFDEIYQVKLSNRLLAEKLKAKRTNTEKTICDVSPRDEADMKELGCQFKAAKKGAGSVEHGERWLDDLDFIIIDPNRCPNTAREFENIDYDIDRYGNPLPRLVDKDNHSIDATRYALEDDMRGKKGMRILR